MAYWDPILDTDYRLNLVYYQIIESEARGVPRAEYAPGLLWDLATAASIYEEWGLRFLAGLPISDRAKLNIDNAFLGLYVRCYTLLTDEGASLGSLAGPPIVEPPPVPEVRPEPRPEARAAERAVVEAAEAPGGEYDAYQAAKRALETELGVRTGSHKTDAQREILRRAADRLSIEYTAAIPDAARVDVGVRRTERRAVAEGRATEAQDRPKLLSRFWGAVVKHPGWTAIAALLVASGAARYAVNELFSAIFGFKPIPPTPRCTFMSTPYGTIIGAVIGVGGGWLASRYLSEEF
jgi:hypothetical protein